MAAPAMHDTETRAASDGPDAPQAAPAEPAPGPSLEEAVLSRYTFTRDPRIRIMMLGPAGRAGAGSLVIPQSAMLDRKGIASVGDLSSVGANFVRLDVSSNALRDWDHVRDILEQQRDLEYLDLSHNPLPASMPAEVAERIASRPSRLKELKLNDTRLEWSTVAALLRCLPDLTELHLCNNGFTSIATLPQHSSLRTLFLTGNHVAQWSEVMNLRHLPLQVLNLRKNPVQGVARGMAAAGMLPPARSHGSDDAGDVGAGAGAGAGASDEGAPRSGVPRSGAGSGAVDDTVPAGAITPEGSTGEPSAPALFTSLNTLYLSNTAIAEWDDVHALRYLPALRRVTLKDVPLLLNSVHMVNDATCRHGTSQEATLKFLRELLVAALPQVENLNGSAIHARARAMAERAFVRALKYSGPDGAEVSADDPSLPPRFHELVAKHGPVHKLANVSIGSDKTFVTVTLRCNLLPRPSLFKVRIGWTGRQLKEALEQVSGIPPDDMLVAHLDKAQDAVIAKRRGTAHETAWRPITRWDHHNERRINVHDMFDGDDLTVSRLSEDPEFQRGNKREAERLKAERSVQSIPVRVVLPPSGVDDPALALAASYGDRLEARIVDVDRRTTTGEFMGMLAEMVGRAPDSIDVYLERSIGCRAAKPDVESARLAAAGASVGQGEGGAGATDSTGADDGAVAVASGAAGAECDDGAYPTRALERMRFPKRVVGHWFAAVNGATPTDRVLVVPKTQAA